MVARVDGVFGSGRPFPAEMVDASMTVREPVVQARKRLVIASPALQIIAGNQSSGSSRTIDAPWLLPTQNVGGVVRLSTKTRRIFVNFGSRYSTMAPLFGLRRSTRSVYSPPAQASPFLSEATSYGHDSPDGAIHSSKRPAFVSYMPMRFARFSPNHRRPTPSSMPRRGADAGVGVGYTAIFPVLASMYPMSPRPKTVK